MSDELKKLKCTMQYGELWGYSLEYPVMKTVDGKVVGMCLEKDSAYVHAFVAAPEMLEALKQAHAMIHNHDFGGAIITIEDAIAKAEGREP